jgi:hypothetical protein
MLFIKKLFSLLEKNIQFKIKFKESFSWQPCLEDELKDVLDHVGVVDDAGLLQ